MDQAVLHCNYSPLACSSPECLREVSSQLGCLLDLSSHQLSMSKAASSDCHEKRKENKRKKGKEEEKRKEKKGGKKGKEEKNKKKKRNSRQQLGNWTLL